MKAPLILAILAGAALLIGEADAANKGVYLGGAIGRSQADVKLAVPSAYDTKDDAFKFIAGVRPLDWFGVETSYLDLGRVQQTQQFPDNSALVQEREAIDAFGVFFFEAGHIDVFVKAGLVKWEAEGSFSSLAGPTDIGDDGTDFAWGIGVQGTLENIALRFEYERFEFDSFFGNIDRPEVLSIGFTWTLQ